MADLVLTPDEKAAQTWFELDDATIGKIVKFAGTKILQGAQQKDMMLNIAATYILINDTFRQNGDQQTIKITGHSLRGEFTGDWIVTIQKIDPISETVE